MAAQVGGDAVLDLGDHGRRLLTRWGEQLLALELEDERGLSTRVDGAAIAPALYEHLCGALEAWRTFPAVDGAAHRAPSS